MGSKGSPGWDVLIIGGGITGAGVLLEAARLGLEAALIEQRDYAWGTSSRSSKFFHGGLRYLVQGQWRLSRDSAKERMRMLQEAPGLVDAMGFIFPFYKGHFPGRWSFMPFIRLYNFFVGSSKGFVPPSAVEFMAPHMRHEGLKGGAGAEESVTDDARVVLRLLQDGRAAGALALNYVKAEGLLNAKEKTHGVSAIDQVSGKHSEIRARVVINATGAWADRLRCSRGQQNALRPLRGSHLIVPFQHLPVSQIIAWRHPEDKRGIFAAPWEGATLVGTTDLDHEEDINEEPAITMGEVDYLLTAVRDLFPYLDVHPGKILSTFAGIRSIVSQGLLRPSRERRNHRIWHDRNLISVSGGKLTTFRLTAHEVTQHALFALGSHENKVYRRRPVFEKAEIPDKLPVDMGFLTTRRIFGYYGSHEAMDLLKNARAEDLERVPGTDTLWAEVRRAAQREDVVHLEDLMLRRTRLGLLLEEGGLAHMRRIGAICTEELGWGEEKWQQETAAYLSLRKRCYSCPPTSMRE